MLRKRRGQSTLEYITVFVAIVAAIVLFAYAKLKSGVENVYNSVGDKIIAAGDQFKTTNLGP